MTTHLLKPGPVDGLAMRCGLRAKDATADDGLGTEDGIRAIDCAPCLHDLIVEMRLDGRDSPEDRWLAGGDTGISSITIWHVMTGRPIPGGQWARPDIPHDPADFGRCHRLLAEFPEWRERMPEVAAMYPEWSGLVERWDDVTALYTEELPSGRAPKCWALMREVSER